MNSKFQVKPVSKYNNPRYHSLHAPVDVDEEQEAKRPAWVLAMSVALLMFGLGTGIMACTGERRCYDSSDGRCPEQSPARPTGPDGGCDVGESYCQDPTTLITCDAEGELQSLDCNAFCRDEDPTGSGWGYSTGCDASVADDPCQCDYDIVDGGEGIACVPGDIYCSDPTTLATCNDEGFDYEYVECIAYCRDKEPTLAEYAYSLGCNPDAADPCQCQYDIVDGDFAGCLPGEVYCNDPATLATCNDDGTFFDMVDCNAYCMETDPTGLGAAYSLGCNPEAADPCQCEYDMVAGGIGIECLPGDIYCVDPGTVATCVDYGGYETQDCTALCQASYGPDSTATGCDASNPANPCGCSDSTGSGGGTGGSGG